MWATGVPRDASVLRKQELRYLVLSAGSLGKERQKSVLGQTHPASYSVWANSKKRPNSANGGLRLPYGEPGLYQFGSPHTLWACREVKLGDATDTCSSDAKEIILKLHVNRGHTTAHQLKHVSIDCERETKGLANYVDAELGQCGISPAFGKAPHIPIAGTSTASLLTRNAK